MGYYSEWCLAIGGKTKDVKKLVEWVEKDLPTEKHGGETVASTVECILNEEKLDFGGDRETTIHWGGMAKCYLNWEYTVDLIREKAEELGLGYAYAEIGEDLQDIKYEDNCKGVHVDINRYIGEVEGPNSSLSNLAVGDEVQWNDPDEGKCSGVYKVKKIVGKVVTIGWDDGTTVETLLEELS